MTTERCPEEEELFALLDEPSTAAALGDHVAGCASCRAKVDELAQMIDDLRAPVGAASADVLVARLERELARGPDAASPPRRWTARAPFVVAAAGALAAAAVIALVPRPPTGADRGRGELTARGGSSEAGAARDVALGLDAVVPSAGGADVVAVTAGTRIAESAHLLLSYSTRSARTPFHVLCFAVDSESEVHWLYPAFEDAASDPASIILAPGRPTTPMPTEVLLDDFPLGRTRVFALITERPMHVSQIERLDAGVLREASLEALFRDADVRSWDLTIEEGTK